MFCLNFGQPTPVYIIIILINDGDDDYNDGKDVMDDWLSYFEEGFIVRFNPIFAKFAISPVSSTRRSVRTIGHGHILTYK